MMKRSLGPLAKAVLPAIFVAALAVSAAGETVPIKASATSVNTKWHPVEVGDVEGHIVAVFENTQVWVSDITGETATACSRGTMDFNTKTGQGTMKGYNVTTLPNGDKRFGAFQGEAAGKGGWKGTFTDIGGTGKYEGITGSGTWEATSLTRGVSRITSEGERTFP